MDTKVIIAALPEMATQLVGFLIVFFILKKFAFGSILGIIDARRKHIEDELAGLEKVKKDSERAEKEYKARLEKVEQEARERLLEVSKTSQNLAKDIQEHARADAQKLADRARADIEQEIAKARLTMRNDIVEISTMITEKVLKEKLEKADHEKLVAKFVQELESIR
jgi:F-type H+-transporting ATPase subunit b